MTARDPDPRLICVFDGRHRDDHTPEELAQCIGDALALFTLPERLGLARRPDPEVTPP